MIYITSAIEETKKKLHLIKLKILKGQPLGKKKKDEFIIVDVYTKSDDKDKFKLFWSRRLCIKWITRKLL